MVLSGYASGTLCWAKLKGYPWWPSRIEDEDALTEEVLDSKPRSGRVYPVLFFGSLDYAWITPENLEPYEENLAKHGSKAKNRKDPSFADALKQAQDPSLLEEVVRRNADSAAAASDSDDASGNGDGDDDEEGARGVDSDGDVSMPSGGPESTRAPARGRRRPNNGRSAQPAAGRKRMSLSSNTSGDDAAPETTPKRSRRAQGGAAAEAAAAAAAKDVSPGTAVRRDSDDAQSAARSGPPSSRQSPERNGGKPAAPGAARDEDAKAGRGAKAHPAAKSGSKTYQLLMHLRHKLQKTVIKGPIPEDLAPVNEVLRRLEDFDMSLDLIQETKLGKVMRIIAESERLKDAPEDRFDIKGRASRLADKWRQLIFKQRGESAEHTTLDSPTSSKAAQPGPQQSTDTEEAAPGQSARRSVSPPRDTTPATPVS